MVLVDFKHIVMVKHSMTPVVIFKGPRCCLHRTRGLTRRTQSKIYATDNEGCSYQRQQLRTIYKKDHLFTK